MSAQTRRGGPEQEPGTARDEVAATVVTRIARAADSDQGQLELDLRPEDRVAFDEAWRAGAEQALSVLAATSEVFSADDLRGAPFHLEEPRSSAHWGAVFSAARAAKLIKPVGFAISATPSRHGGVLRLWRGVDS